MLFLLKHPLRTAYILFLSFPWWYIWKVPKAIVLKYFSYAHAFGEIISFSFLLRTLFRPWKNITDTPSGQKGFSLERFVEKIVFNSVTRVIGFLFRSILILIGVVIQLLCLALFLLFLALWYGYPVAVFFGVQFLLAVS
ncbi:hypothetical protein COU77_01530 [Candidatus Peregrinibacteria bacterium CG10_big_fil_rev_8_21_14_0_10_49_16]|nr:MAG: hypothetical protein COU77_01530 [Candidatus Peregrinibacteria bacterium CG10_big_fil_rev_8_21_14_0_10_49_16]